MGHTCPKPFEMFGRVDAIAPACRIVIVVKPFAAVGRSIGRFPEEALT